jgi:hypothetical protein
MLKKIIKKVIWELNGNIVTREFLMIPVIFCRDKLLDLKNYRFIRAGQKQLSQFKGIHEGERCFVIGNGPSLSLADLDLIKGEYSFAANRIYDIYSKTVWRPTYYGIQDLYVLKEITKEVEDEENGAKTRFIVSNRPDYMCDEMKTDPKNKFFYLGTCLSEHRKIKIASEFDKTVGHGGTITYAMIQLAMYMGFKEIYLLGVDHNYKNYMSNDGNFDKEAHAASHFEGAKAYKNLRTSNVPQKKGVVYVSTKAYQTAENYSRKHGIRIFNATRGGKLEVFERTNLEDIVK